MDEIQKIQHQESLRRFAGNESLKTKLDEEAERVVRSYQFDDKQQRGQTMNGLNEPKEIQERRTEIKPQLERKGFFVYNQECKEIIENGKDGAIDVFDAVASISKHDKYQSLFRPENKEIIRSALTDLLTKNQHLVLQNLHYMKLRDEELVKKGSLDAMHEGTFYHSVAVGATAAILYDKLKSHSKFKDDLKDVSLYEMFSGAILHDAGKVMIPGVELHQKEKLSDDQWKKFMWHPVDGETLLSLLNSQKVPTSCEYQPRVSKVAVDIAAMHHLWPSYKPEQGKRLKSYPLQMYDRKEGDYFVADIPAHVKIPTVADGFDAMAGRRTYGKDRSIDEVLAELSRESKLSERNTEGVHYDPQVVYALCDVIYGR